jgi:CP family cyanate transporter-like MFS transporter
MTEGHRDTAGTSAMVSDTAVAVPPLAVPRTVTPGRVGVGAALVLAGFSLRPALASVGALLDELRSGLGMNATVAGLLIAIPSACFALVGLLVPRLTRRLGPGAVVCMAMSVVAVGLLARAVAGNATVFLACSAIAVAGIGAGNVVMPVAVRRYFPDRVGLLTGLYSTSLTAGAALSAAVSVPAADHLDGGWRSGLGIWALPALAAAAACLLLLPRRASMKAHVPALSRGGRSDDRARGKPLVRSPTAWALSVFFGLQAAGAYIVLGWLPQILRDAGVSAGTAGLLLALIPAVGIPFAFLIPALAAKLPNQGGLVVALSAVGFTGYVGLWLAPAALAWLWAVLLGISQAAFPLALTMIGLRGRSTAEVAHLSAFAQGIGYLIATPCPLLVGVLYQHSHGWHAPLAFMATLLIPQTVAGILAGRRRSSSDAPVPHTRPSTDAVIV